MHTKYGSKDEMWLSFNNETEKIHFPVNPEKITVECNGKISTVDISGLGEIAIKQDRPAMTISWQSFLPSSYFPGMNFTAIYNPYWVANRIKGWIEQDGPCHFLITETPINLYVLVGKYKTWEVGGDVGTVYYDIQLKEFRNTAPRQIELVDTTAVIDDADARVDNRVQPKSYTVVSGDSLWTIAKKVWGNGGRWREIYNANKDKIKNPNLIYAGQEFVIPG